jgi:hypothetical protein
MGCISEDTPARKIQDSLGFLLAYLCLCTRNQITKNLYDTKRIFSCPMMGRVAMMLLLLVSTLSASAFTLTLEKNDG